MWHFHLLLISSANLGKSLNPSKIHFSPQDRSHAYLTCIVRIGSLLHTTLLACSLWLLQYWPSRWCNAIFSSCHCLGMVKAWHPLISWKVGLFALKLWNWSLRAWQSYLIIHFSPGLYKFYRSPTFLKFWHHFRVLKISFWIAFLYFWQSCFHAGVQSHFHEPILCVQHFMKSVSSSQPSPDLI